MMKVVFFSAVTLFLCSCAMLGPRYELLVVDTGGDTGQGIVWPDEGLKSTFQEYWAFRLSKQPKRSFEMEAPYLREAANYKRYENFVNGTREGLHVIRVENLTYRNRRLVWIHCSLPVDGHGEKGFGITDEWLLLDGKWYHVLKGQLLFPEFYS